jgi:hypothetical protein
MEFQIQSLKVVEIFTFWIKLRIFECILIFQKSNIELISIKIFTLTIK